MYLLFLSIIAVALPRKKMAVKAIGNRGGEWVVPRELIRAGMCCYCVGVGENATFDLSLSTEYACEVVSFDPTPRAISYVNELQAKHDLTKWQFVPIAVWKADGSLRLYEPANPEHVSHSALNLQNTTKYIEVHSRRLKTIMCDRGHRQIDLLKLDIEGAEHDVLADMLTSDIRPQVVCFEMDQPCSLGRMWKTCRGLAIGGYAVINISGWNVTLVALQAGD